MLLSVGWFGVVCFTICRASLDKCLFRYLFLWKNWVVNFYIIEFWEFFIYSEYKFFIRSLICKYFLLVWSFHFLNSIFQWAEVLKNLCLFLLIILLGDTPKLFALSRVRKILYSIFPRNLFYFLYFEFFVYVGWGMK